MDRDEFYIPTISLENFFLEVVGPNLNGVKLSQSRDLPGYSVKPREFLALYLLSVYLSELEGRPFRPAIRIENIRSRNGTRNPFDDGALADVENGISIEIEHTYVYHGLWSGKPAEGVRELIIKKSLISYNPLTWLVIHVDAEGQFNPDWIRDELEKSKFSTVLLIAQIKKVYYVQMLKYDGTIINSLYSISINEIDGSFEVENVE